MVDQHWNPESEARDAELIYNKNADGSSTHRNRFSNLMLHLDVAGNHMDRPPGHDEHHNDRRASSRASSGSRLKCTADPARHPPYASPQKRRPFTDGFHRPEIGTTTDSPNPSLPATAPTLETNGRNPPNNPHVPSKGATTPSPTHQT